jgi:hypothetical protein
MRAMKTDLSALPTGVLVVLGVVLLIELALDVIALADLYRRPLDQVALGNKWVWVAIIILVNLIGPILYLAIGRKPAVPSGGAAPARPGSAADVADKLYGPRDDSTHP